MSTKWVVLICSVGLMSACGGGTPGAQNPGGGGVAKAHKGGGAKGAAAKDSGQRAGGHASHDKSRGSDKGASFDDVGCDSELEGLAWCESETELAMCSGGEWWVLDCAHPDIDGDFCGDTGTTVDCFAVSELE